VNVDAGTLRPTEHGEVWVTDDGGEIDQDLGHYERFLNISLPKKNNLTTGQIYQQVIDNERLGKYLGKTVEIIPHITDEIKRRIRAVGDENTDFVIVEIGGTVGDYQNVPFLEAVRQMRFEDEEHVVFVHLVFVPVPSHLGEAKTKPAQHSTRELMGMGIHPDFVVCRTPSHLDQARRDKIALFCNVKPQHIISAPDVGTIYEVPLLLEAQQFSTKILNVLDTPPLKSNMHEWARVVNAIKSANKEIVIGMVGKYVNTGDFTLADSYVSVNEALHHAGAHHNVRVRINWIDASSIDREGVFDGVDGILVPGGFGSSGVEGKIKAIQYAREHEIPFLGLCFGLQLAVVEFARNVVGLDADSTETNTLTKHPVICVLPDQKNVLAQSRYGASMRLGAYPAVLAKDSRVSRMYGSGEVSHRHRHRYEVNPAYHKQLSEAGLVFSGRSPDGLLVEFIELPNHPFFVGTQAHPEFSSRFEAPEPLFSAFVAACAKELEQVERLPHNAK